MQVLRGQLRSRFSILNNENILNPGHFNVFFYISSSGTVIICMLLRPLSRRLSAQTHHGM